MLVFRLQNESLSIDVFKDPHRLNVTKGCRGALEINESSLTVIEGDLLCLLLDEGQVSRERCMSTLWDGRIISDSSRSLTQVISTLRKKLRQCGIDDLISTKPRIGYLITRAWNVIDMRNTVHLDDALAHENKVIQLQTESINIYSLDKQPLDKEYKQNIGAIKKTRLDTSLAFFVVSFIMSLLVTFRWYSYDHMHVNSLAKRAIKPHLVNKLDESNVFSEAEEFRVKNELVAFGNVNAYYWRKSAEGWFGVITSTRGSS